MTGFGEARRQEDGVSIAVEVRTINSRYFKIAFAPAKAMPPWSRRSKARFASASNAARCRSISSVDRPASPDAYRINTPAALGLLAAIERSAVAWNLPRPAGLESLLALPGVVNDRRVTAGDAEQDWPLVSASRSPPRWTTWPACAKKKARRWRTICGRIAARSARELEQIAGRAPQMVDAYRGRLEERLKENPRRARRRSGAGRRDPRDQHLRRAVGYFRGNRPAAQPFGAIRERSWGWRKAPAASWNF